MFILKSEYRHYDIFILIIDEPYDYCLCVIEGEETKVRKAQSIMYQILERCADMDMNTCFLIRVKISNLEFVLYMGCSRRKESFIEVFIALIVDFCIQK